MDNLYFDDDTDIQAILTGKLTLVLLSAVMATLKLYALHWLNSLPRGLPRKRVKKRYHCQDFLIMIKHCNVIDQEFISSTFQLIFLSLSHSL